MKLGRPVLIQSYPRVEDYTVRAGIVTCEHANGTVDLIVFNSQEDIRDASMPVSQSIGNVPYVELNAEKPTDYRGRWVCTPLPPEPEKLFGTPAEIWEGLSDDERNAVLNAKNGEAVRVKNLKGKR